MTGAMNLRAVALCAWVASLAHLLILFNRFDVVSPGAAALVATGLLSAIPALWVASAVLLAPGDVRDASVAAEGKAEEDSEDDFDIVLGDAAGERVSGDGEPARPREVYQGVPAPKRLRVTENSAFSKRAVPDKFKVVDGDDEATRERKRKQAKAFKGKQRMLEKDAEQTAKKNDWQSFQAKVGGKKKTGFMTKKVGSKKGSMFGTKD